MLWQPPAAIGFAIAACMVAALLFGQFVPARYTAFMQVLIDPNDLRVVDNVLRGQNQLTETHVDASREPGARSHVEQCRQARRGAALAR